MNDSLPDLEAELRRLPLPPPSPRLLAGIGRELACPAAPAHGRIGRSLAWSGLGLAAALAVVATVGLGRFRHAETPVVVAGGPVVIGADRDVPMAGNDGPDELRAAGPASLPGGQADRRARYRSGDALAMNRSGAAAEFRVIPVGRPRYFHRPEGFAVQFP